MGFSLSFSMKKLTSVIILRLASNLFLQVKILENKGF